MKKYDVKSIMAKAWAIRRRAAAEMGCKVSDVIFSICLKMAWASAKAPVSVIDQWQAMTEKAKLQIMAANVKKAAKNEIGYSTEDNYAEFNETVAWFLQHHGIDCLVNETWLRLQDRLQPEYLEALNDRREEKGHKPITLVALVYRSAKDAIRSVYASDVKHGRARVHTITDSNGESYDYIDTMATSPKDSTENVVLHKLAMEEFASKRDAADLAIIRGIYNGKKQKEIAKDLGITPAAIHKRIVKIRTALVAAGIAPSAWAVA